MAKHKIPNTRIIQFESDDDLAKKLVMFTNYNNSNNSQLTFSEYLTRTTAMERIFKSYSDKDKVIVDLSNRQIIGKKLENVDFGEVILNNTIFSDCNLKKAKITSKVSMEGLKFQNGSQLQNATISGDLGGVSFEGETNISDIDLTQATGLGRCKIDPEKVRGTGIKIPFSSFEAFDDYLKDFKKPPDLSEYQPNQEKPEQESAIQKDSITIAELSQRGRETAVELGQRALDSGQYIGARAIEAGQAAIDAASNIGEVRIPTTAQGVVNMVGSGIYSGLGMLARGVISAAQNMAPQAKQEENSVEQERGVNQQAYRNPNIPENASESLNIFVCKPPSIDITQEKSISEADLIDWNKNSTKSLSEYAKERGVAPIVKNLNISKLEFKGKDFGETAFLECNFENLKIANSKLENVTFLDSKFKNVSMHELEANGLKIERSNFNNCDIQKSNMDRANFSESKFIETDISNTRLEAANFHRAYVKDLKIEKSDLNNSMMDHMIGTDLSLDQVLAQNSDISESKILGAKISNTDLSNSTAHNASLPKAKIDTVNFDRMEGVSLGLQEASIIKSRFDNANLGHSDLNGSKLTNCSISNSNMTKANLSNSELEGVVFERTSEQGINFENSKSNNSKLIDCDLSLSNLGSFEIGTSEIKNCDLYGANIQKSKFKNVSITNSDLVGADLTESKITGGSLENSKLQGAKLNKTEIGSEDMLTSVTDLEIDGVTDLTNAKISHPQAKVTYEDRFGKKTKKTLGDAKEKSQQEQNINEASLPVKLARGIINNVAGFLKVGGDGAKSVGSSLTTKRKSRAGMITGALVGVGIGAAIIGATAASMGAALPVAAGIILGTGAIAGAATGHVVANTSKGRRLFMGAATIASGMAFGIGGLVAGPALAGYYLLTGKRNALSTALGETFKTVGNLSQRTGAALSGLTYSDKEIVEANDIKEQREKNVKILDTQKEELSSVKPNQNIKRQSRIRRFFSRPFVKKSKKEEKIGIVDAELFQKKPKEKEVVSIEKQKEAAPEIATINKDASDGDKSQEMQSAALPSDERSITNSEEGIFRWALNGAYNLFGYGRQEEQISSAQNMDSQDLGEARSRASSTDSSTSFESIIDEPSRQDVVRSRPNSIASSVSSIGDDDDEFHDLDPALAQSESQSRRSSISSINSTSPQEQDVVRSRPNSIASSVADDDESHDLDPALAKLAIQEAKNGQDIARSAYSDVTSKEESAPLTVENLEQHNSAFHNNPTLDSSASDSVSSISSSDSFVSCEEEFYELDPALDESAIQEAKNGQDIARSRSNSSASSVSSIASNDEEFYELDPDLPQSWVNRVSKPESRRDSMNKPAQKDGGKSFTEKEQQRREENNPQQDKSESFVKRVTEEGSTSKERGK